ncbi:MAG TPA: GldG family protein [Chloroflexi bacterium]|jgi:ABC-type uncharacterized transport system involved in gliding motility auxiliary subunit|nr:GldG family protein [Chloroflexota bacterium]
MRQRLLPLADWGALVGAIVVLVSLGAMLVLGTATLWIEIAAGLGAALVLLPVLLNPTRTKAALLGRRARYGGNALVATVALVGILALLNYLGARHPLRFDVTAEQQFSLSEQTLQILESLEEPVHVTLFFTPGHYNRMQVNDLIQEYALRSPKLTYEFIDPDLEPRRAMEYQVSRDGVIIFERGERREFCFGTQEQDLTSALLRASSDRIKGVYFLTGHQERSIEESGERSLYQVAEVLRNENYSVNTFNLAVTDTVPSDMDVLVIADPRKPLSDEEVDRLRAFIDEGVGVLAMIEPGVDGVLGGLLEEYGVTLTDDLVIDPMRSFFGDMAAPLVDSYAYHQITKDLAGFTSFFPTARSIALMDPVPEGWTAQLLASSSPSGWAETRYLEEQVALDDADTGGPVGLAAVIEPTTTDSGKGRLVVVGDADFCSDSVLTRVRGNIGNLDLFMNAVGWLAEEDALISIRPKQPELRQVVLTPPQARAIIYSNVLFVPLIVLAAGGMVWWRRR